MREPTKGTPLRDGAVDPRDRDFLGPINAGQDDPQGPNVVSPGIHAVSGQAVKPGPVYVDDVRRQEAEQKEFARRIYLENEPVPEVSAALGDPDYAVRDESAAPAAGAVKAEWIDYAVSRGATREDAEAMTKAELAERYGS